MLIPSPCVTDSRTLILWLQDLVPSFVRFSDIPFPYGINILVATLFIFRERATKVFPTNQVAETSRTPNSVSLLPGAILSQFIKSLKDAEQPEKASPSLG